MHDRDIRLALVRELEVRHSSSPNTLLVHEMGVCSGAARVDIAVINSHLAGFEIKSAQDTLTRLEGQIATYARVFDRLTVVTEPEHSAKVMEVVPEWVGVAEARPARFGVRIVFGRRSRDNPNQEPIAVAQLLWREEALRILSERGLASGLMSRPRRHAWERLASSLAPEDLKGEVRDALRARVGWIPDVQRTPGGGTFRLVAT